MIVQLLIFIGGGIGACLRYILSTLTNRLMGSHYPYGTFFVNIIGCLFIGFIVALAINKSHIIGPNLKIFLTIGIAGGFTTFSTFGYESLDLIKQGHAFASIVYPVSSVVLGILAVYLGMYLARYV